MLKKLFSRPTAPASGTEAKPSANGARRRVMVIGLDCAAPELVFERWLHDLLFWPLPLWFFAVLYVAVWLYALLLWRLVPPRWRRARGRRPAAE